VAEQRTPRLPGAGRRQASGRIEQRRSDMALPWIVSVDDHVIEPPHIWQTWLPAKFREQAPRVVKLPWEVGPGFRGQHVRPANSGPEVDFWAFEDFRIAVLQIEAAAGVSPDKLTNTPVNYSDMRPGCHDPKARLRDLDEVRIERSLCFPNVVRFCGQVFLWMKDKELALACVRAYNDWMVEEWGGDSGGRLLPLCIVPLWDPALAAAEVRRNAARGVRSVTFSELPSALDLPSIHDKGGHWLPFIQACDDTDTVISVHIGSSSTVAQSSPDAPPLARMSTLSFNAQLAFTDWIVSGHLQRYPNFKLSFSESQVGWMPYVLERIDRSWRVGNAIARIDPIFKEAPSSYISGRVFGCFFEDTFGVESRHAIGVDQITFEADYPHQDSTWPHTYEYLTEVLDGVPEDEAHKITRGNAIRMLGLDPEPLVEDVAVA
jgi:predicted TIM-barrel fold metal-dependent hydrolase